MRDVYEWVEVEADEVKVGDVVRYFFPASDFMPSPTPATIAVADISVKPDDSQVVKLSGPEGGDLSLSFKRSGLLERWEHVSGGGAS